MTEITHCPICRKPVDFYEKVNLDIINTVTHQSCNSEAIIKDSGTFIEMIKKYPFLKPSYLNKFINKIEIKK